MSPMNMPELDDLIERTLRSEPLRSVPAGFDTRVRDRVRVAAAVKGERRRFQFRMTMMSALFASLALVLVVAPYLSVTHAWIDMPIPGALGYKDSLLVFALRHWVGVTITGLVFGIAIVTAAMAVISRTRESKGVKTT